MNGAIAHMFIKLKNLKTYVSGDSCPIFMYAKQRGHMGGGGVATFEFPTRGMANLSCFFDGQKIG